MNSGAMTIVRVAAPVRQQVIDMLRAAIADGRYVQGERLIERELCETLQVSRPILREALRQLEAEGLLRNVPQRGLEVVTLSGEDVRQIYEIRSALESLAAAQFIEHAVAQQWAELDMAMEEFENAAEMGAISRVQAAKTRFYNTIMAGSGNPIMAQVLRGLHNRAQLLRGSSLAEPGRLAKTIKEIRAIHQALHRRDPSRTREVYAAHITAAAEATQAALWRINGAALEFRG